MTSAFGKFDLNDFKHLLIEAALTAGITGLGVLAAYATDHQADIGLAGPILVFVSGIGASFFKKLLTDNTASN